jgi:hypothetical protein
MVILLYSIIPRPVISLEPFTIMRLVSTGVHYAGSASHTHVTRKIHIVLRGKITRLCSCKNNRIAEIITNAGVRRIPKRFFNLSRRYNFVALVSTLLNAFHMEEEDRPLWMVVCMDYITDLFSPQ